MRKAIRGWWGLQYQCHKLIPQPGIPLEFSNVCEAMIFFQSHKNINLHTQVKHIGSSSPCLGGWILLGYQGVCLPKGRWQLPLDGVVWPQHPVQRQGGHGAPQGAPELPGDLLHGAAEVGSRTDLWTSLRICSEKSIKETQWQGGSEVTTNSAEELKEVRGSLSDKRLPSGTRHGLPKQWPVRQDNPGDFC